MSIFDADDYLKDAKREQRAFVGALSCFAQDAGLRELFDDDPSLILGSLHELADLLKTKVFRETARERGEGIRRRREANRPKPQPERLRLQLAEEPVGELAAKLEMFVRETASSVRPIIFAGVGSAEEFKFLMGPGARLKRHPLESPSSGGNHVSANPPAVEHGYKVANIPPIENTTILGAATEQIETTLEGAIRQEGPISESLLFGRIKTVFGVHSIRKDAASRVRGVLNVLIERGSLLEIDPGFFMVAEGTVIARNRSGQDEKVRAVCNLPPCEIRSAVEDCVKRGGLHEDKDFTCKVARLLGYTLKSASTLPTLAAAIDCQIACWSQSEVDRTPSHSWDSKALEMDGAVISKLRDTVNVSPSFSEPTS